jgi:hypothetical protein
MWSKKHWEEAMMADEVILKARDAFNERDRVARQLREIDGEIKVLVHEYSAAVKLWGFTPDMLRQAVRARLGS